MVVQFCMLVIKAEFITRQKMVHNICRKNSTMQCMQWIKHLRGKYKDFKKFSIKVPQNLLFQHKPSTFDTNGGRVRVSGINKLRTEAALISNLSPLLSEAHFTSEFIWLIPFQAKICNPFQSWPIVQWRCLARSRNSPHWQ